MAQVIVSPEEVRHFARQFKTCNAQLLDLTTRLRGQFSNLGETWRDQEYQRFAVEFEQASRILQQFMRQADQYIPYLERKAAAAQAFLDQR